MEQEFWRRVEDVYYEVLANPPESRALVLEKSTSGDGDLRREVESLIAARDNAGDFLASDVFAKKPKPVLKAPGTTVGSYVIQAHIGAGSAGDVYRARDGRLGRQVALKILRTQVTDDESRVARFQAEARAASALNHSNVVTVFEIGHCDGVWFIASEFIEGISLRERLKNGPLPAAEALHIVIQCADALDAAHQMGMVHRDIKPENIMLRPDGVVKIVDFGLAKLVELQPDWSLHATETGSVLGTPRYMSPEQARGQKLDKASDVFSLGAVLYELVLGWPAFPGSTMAEVFAALLEHEPDTKEAGAFQEVLSRALKKDRTSRYASAGEFAADLRSLDIHAPRRFHLRFRTHRVPKLAVPIIAISAAVAVYFLLPQERRPEAPKVVQITTYPGLKDHPALSPKGDRVVFSWRDLNQSALHLYIKPLAGGKPLQLTSSLESDVLPAWSPDGERIAFCRRPTWYSGFDRQFRAPSDTYIISARGGPERRVAEGWAGVSWSADGKHLALARFPSSGEDSGGIDLFSIETGERRRLTTSREDILPAFSPDGRWIAFTRIFPGGNSPGGPREIFIVSASGGPARQLTFDGKYIAGATWMADSREVIFSSPRNRQLGELWRVPAVGGTPIPISAGVRYAFSPSVSQTGNRLVFREEWTDANIYSRSGPGLSGGKPGRFGERSPVVVSTRDDHAPVISPDGKRIAFVSDRSASREIWITPVSGGEAVQLTWLGQQMLESPNWSPDGRQIVFSIGTPGHASLYVVNVDGGKPRALDTGHADSHSPAWSVDGEWIYFTSARSGRREIWKIPPAGGEPVQLTHEGAFEARPSPDGKKVFFSKGHKTGCCTISSMPVQGGPEERLPGLEKFASISRSWGVLNEGIYFVVRSNDPLPAVRFLSFATHKVTDLVLLEKGPGWLFPGLAMTPDARRLLTVELDHAVNDLMMVENFN